MTLEAPSACPTSKRKWPLRWPSCGRKVEETAARQLDEQPLEYLYQLRVQQDLEMFNLTSLVVALVT